MLVINSCSNFYLNLKNMKKSLTLFVLIILVGCKSYNSFEAIKINDEGVDKYDNGNFTEAIIDFTKAIELDSENPLFYQNRATAKSSMAWFGYGLEDYNGAINDLDIAISLDGKETSYYKDRAYIKTIISDLRLPAKTEIIALFLPIT